MKTKRISYAGAGIFVLLVVAATVLVLSVNSIARYGIERGAGYATGTEVVVENVKVGLLSGTFSMSGPNVSNPKDGGFDSDYFVRLATFNTSLSLGSLRKEMIEIPALHLNGLELTLERKDGAENYKVILENLQRLASEVEREPDEDAKKFVIRDLAIRDIRVHLMGYPGGSRTITLADIHMSDAGTGGEPVTTAHLTGMVIREVLHQVMLNPNLIPSDLTEGLGDSLHGLEKLGDVGVKFRGKVKDEAGRVIGEIPEKIEESISGAIRDLFGADKEEADRDE